MATAASWETNVKINYLILSAALAAAPIASVVAQSNGPAVGATETKPADPKPGATTSTPGATVPPGSNSTLAGDKAATAEKKTGSTGSDGGGK
jgi:hypothetical protein